MTIKELQTEYKNLTSGSISSFIDNIRKAQMDPSISSLLLLGALDSMCEEFIPQIKAICAKDGLLSAEDESLIKTRGQILAAQMIVTCKTKSSIKLRNRVMDFCEIASRVVSGKYNFLKFIPKVLSLEIQSIGFDWTMVANTATLDLLVHQLLTRTKFGNPLSKQFAFSEKGFLSAAGDTITLSPYNTYSAGIQAYSLENDAFEIITNNTKEDKLKASDIGQAAALHAFARNFVATQNAVRHLPARQSRKLKEGDRVTVKCVGLREVDGHDMVECEILGAEGTATALIEDEELIIGTYTEDLVPYIAAGDCIRNAEVIELGAQPIVSIKEAYTSFAKAQSFDDNKKDVVFEAKAVAVINGKINWLTAGGYGAISNTEDMEDIEEGDIAILSLTSCHTSGGRTFINASYPRYTEPDIIRRFDEDTVLANFVTPLELAWKSIDEKNSATPQEKLEGIRICRSIERIILNSTGSLHGLELYRRLLAALFVAQVTSDDACTGTVLRRVTFLGHCLSFAQQGEILPILDEGYMTEEQCNIVSALSFFHRPDDFVGISRFIANLQEDSMSVQIASLIHALGISSEFKDFVKADPEHVREKICDLIGMEKYFQANGAYSIGKYGSAENHNIEFKSSYVMRNDGKGADLNYQGRGQVFEAVCGFLNADGGTVYIGVNDKTGDPILSDEYGINGDISWLMQNYDEVNKTRSAQLGHSIPRVKSIDSFVQFLDFEKQIYFRKSLQGNIIIEPTPDNDAIQIVVRPSEFEIAYLYTDATHSRGKAYTRDGGRTIPMSRVAKQQRMMNLKKIDKEINFAILIQEAIDSKRKIIFKGYSSGSSGEVKDRLVVPINLFYNDENVLCYDIPSGKIKQFRLARISAIDTNVDEPYYPHTFEPMKADVFRWISDERFHIRLLMETGAKNYLLEEYSDAKNLPAQELYEREDGKWILDTTLQGLGGVTRFYLGLADRIQIEETEHSDLLRRYIQDYVGKYL